MNKFQEVLIVIFQIHRTCVFDFQFMIYVVNNRVKIWIGFQLYPLECSMVTNIAKTTKVCNVKLSVQIFTILRVFYKMQKGKRYQRRQDVF